MQHDSELKDISGKSLPAIDVFAMSIQYLRDRNISRPQSDYVCIDCARYMDRVC